MPLLQLQVKEIIVTKTSARIARDRSTAVVPWVKKLPSLFHGIFFIFHGEDDMLRLSLFDDKELELLISGLPDIDIEDPNVSCHIRGFAPLLGSAWQDLKQNTEYHNYTPQSDQVQWFLGASQDLCPLIEHSR